MMYSGKCKKTENPFKLALRKFFLEAPKDTLFV